MTKVDEGLAINYENYHSVRTILFNTPTSESVECISLYLLDIVSCKVFGEQQDLLEPTVDMIKFHLDQLAKRRSVTEAQVLEVLNFARIMAGMPAVTELA